ncbi:MAG: preprotein translocase subunit YajC [Gammaproteobacteria bacterium]|nr:preprotein translocase subunit YajC [Gammaproteobacteria bacterium]
MSFLISDAMAQTAGASGSPGIMSFLPMIALFVIFYFLLIRPQQKRQKDHKNMVSGLAKGDEIVTMGGVLGKITAVGENFLTVEVAKGTELKVQKVSVQAMMPKGTYK